MQTALDRKLLVVTGKGGVGKTTVAAAIGLLAARRGRKTIVVELGEERRLPAMFGLAKPRPGVERKLRPDLWTISIDPDRALLEWLQALGGRVSGRLLASSGTFQYFAAAAPGARELVTMVKIAQLLRGDVRGGREGEYELVVLDASATGHALGLLDSPRTFGAIARVGPIVAYTRRIRELLANPAESAYLGVAQGTEMAVTEAIELQEGLRRTLARDLDAVLMNALLPRRFSAAEMRRIDALRTDARGDGARAARGGEPAAAGAERAVTAAAVAAAHAAHDRARFQHNQLARLRRRGFEVVSIPFAWGDGVGLETVSAISRRLERAL